MKKLWISSLLSPQEAVKEVMAQVKTYGLETNKKWGQALLLTNNFYLDFAGTFSYTFL